MLAPTPTDHERPQWHVLTILEKYEGVDIDLYRELYGKAEGERRFFAENSPSETVTRRDNLLLIGGASALWEWAIGNGTVTAGQPLTYLAATTAYLRVGDGGPTALSGTASVTNGSTAVTFSTSQSGVNGNYITILGDSSAGVYKATGSGTSFTISPAYGGATNASATAQVITSEIATQTDLAASSNKTGQVMDAGFPIHTDLTGSSAKTVTAATNATPIQITTSTTHGFSEGDFVAISGVGGNTAANGVWQIHVVDTSNFTLLGSAGNATWTSGGAASKQPCLVFQATFGTSQANYPWLEWCVCNASTGGRAINRKVTSLGVKSSSTSYALKVAIGLQ